MSSFGASDIKMKKWNIDWLISSANKCIEGVPGFSFVIAEKKALAASEGNARSLCFDLYSQNEDMRKNGQFRFTPPTHSILAFHRALLELEAEGGAGARMKRYQENCRILRKGMAKMGFEEFLAPDDHGWIITSFRYPVHKNFSFDEFYDLLRDDGFVIDPGEAEHALPWLGRGVVQKAWKYEEEAFVDAYQLTARLLEGAKAEGCAVREGVSATRILTADSGVCGVETEQGVLETRRVVLETGIFGNVLLAEHADQGLAIPMAPVRSQYWISEMDDARFPCRRPIRILPDARAYTRPENGNPIFGWREMDGVAEDPRTLPRDIFGHAFAGDPDGWENLAGCAESFAPYFPGVEDTGMAHYVAGFSGYAPDGLFCVGTFPGVPGLVAASGCSGMGIAVSGGVGLAASQLALGETPFADISPFAHARLGAIEPFSPAFMRRCVEARSAKKSG